MWISVADCRRNVKGIRRGGDAEGLLRESSTCVDASLMIIGQLSRAERCARKKIPHRGTGAAGSGRNNTQRKGPQDSPDTGGLTSPPASLTPCRGRGCAETRRVRSSNSDPLPQSARYCHRRVLPRAGFARCDARAKRAKTPNPTAAPSIAAICGKPVDNPLQKDPLPALKAPLRRDSGRPKRIFPPCERVTNPEQYHNTLSHKTLQENRRPGAQVKIGQLDGCCAEPSIYPIFSISPSPIDFVVDNSFKSRFTTPLSELLPGLPASGSGLCAGTAAPSQADS